VREASGGMKSPTRKFSHTERKSYYGGDTHTQSTERNTRDIDIHTTTSQSPLHESSPNPLLPPWIG
jgi:hypothetical protein